MKITILGCGSSGGVPLIGNRWGDCDPNDPRNRRTRVSILVEHNGTTVMVDTSPDMREQMLVNKVLRLDAVLYTHAHADHCHGIDELRSVNWMMEKPVAIYGDAATIEDLKARFPYIFDGVPRMNNYYKPAVTPHIVTPPAPFTVGGIVVQPFAQGHANIGSLGFRFGDFAYTTDAKSLDEAAFATLAGIKVWVVDCVREEPHPTHAHLAQTLEWIARVRPERAYLTHMNHQMDYAAIAAKLPPGVWPSYDGLVIEC